MTTDEAALQHDNELAESILRAVGLELASASLAPDGESNRVWLGDTWVLRIAPPHTDYLAREIALVQLLPSTVGYPSIRASGNQNGRCWLLTDRIPGDNLRRSWDTLSAHTQRNAIEDLWTRLEAVHRADADRVRALGATSTPFYALTRTDSTRLVRQVLDLRLIDDRTASAADSLLDDAFAAMADVAWCLNHTDPGPHNTVFDGQSAIPIDFEFACLAPVDLDLAHLLRYTPDPVIESLRNAARDDVDRAGARSRLAGYTILFDMWALTVWHGHAGRRDRAPQQRSLWPPKDVRDWTPWQQLQDHIAPDCPMYEPFA